VIAILLMIGAFGVYALIVSALVAFGGLAFKISLAL